MKLAIIGPCFSGKTTIFNALTGAAEELSDFSGGGKPHMRETPVPDPRLDQLTSDWQPKKISPARVEFLDTPGYGGSEKFFGEVRQQQALVRVVRAFGGDAVPHPKQRIDWRADVIDLDTDFVLQDLAMVERRIERLEKSTKKPSKTQKEELAELEVFRKVLPSLEEGVALRKSVTDPEERATLATYGFITLKPTLTLVNLGDDDDPASLEIPPVDLDALEKGGVDDITLPIKARLEAEVAQLDEEDRAEFLADFGLQEPARDRLIRLSYQLLGLMSFLTGGPKEVRAWTIPNTATAVEAAKAIHSDIARGFIRAEIVSWEDYVACGGWKPAKEAKKMRLEGKEYRMQDGDVVEFRHGG
jgi:ribosome-binding ATPase